MNNKMIISTRKITSIFTGILLLAIIGVFQFISLGCDINKLLEWNFYLTLAYRTILVFLSYSTAINFLYDRCMKNPELDKAITEFKTLTKLRDLNFTDFLNTVYNPRLKREAWIMKINQKITKVERRTLRAKFNFTKKRCLKKIQDLKAKLDPEYIDENLERLNVKYNQVLESDFLSAEFYDSASANSTRINYEKVLAKSIFKKIIPFIFMSILLGLMVTNQLEGELNYKAIWISILSDLSIIAIRIGQGAYDCPIIINSAYLLPYQNRISILKEYINWSALQPKTKAYKISEMITKEDSNNESQRNN